MMLKFSVRLVLLLAVAAAGLARADMPWTFSDNTRYLALGDSLAAGYGAMPTTNGYAYLLYQQGVFDQTSNTLFANAAVPGATSQDVLDHQLPQAIQRFAPHVVTLSVGGNDLLAIFAGADPNVVLPQLQSNLTGILCGLKLALPQSRIYIHNLYDVPEITGGPGTQAFALLMLVNNIIAGVAQGCGASLADVFSAFRDRAGLLLVERHGSGQFEVHPTNAGYHAIAQAFAAAQQ
jgi:lysophospholipase L1-like esterase